MINNKRRMFCPQGSNFHPKWENDVLQFQFELYLRFLEIIYDSVLSDVAYCSQNLFCNLYYIWVFANKYFSEIVSSLNFFQNIFFQSAILLKNPKLLVPLCHTRNYSVNLTSYTYNASFLSTTHLSLNNWIWETKNQSYRRY